MSYIGEREVQQIADNIVTFTDGESVQYTPRQLEYLVTEEPLDDSKLRMLVIENVVPDMLQVWKDHDVKKVDMDVLYQASMWEYNRFMQIAIGKAFGTYEEGKHEAYFAENIRWSHIKKLIEE